MRKKKPPKKTGRARTRPESMKPTALPELPKSVSASNDDDLQAADGQDSAKLGLVRVSEEPG